MKLSSFILSLLIFIFALTTIFYIIQDFETEYTNVSNEGKLTSSVSQNGNPIWLNINKSTGKIQEDLEELSETEGGGILTLVTGGWSILTATVTTITGLIIPSIGYASTIIVKTLGDGGLGLPGWAMGLILAILLVSVIFAVLSAWRRYEM